MPPKERSGWRPRGPPPQRETPTDPTELAKSIATQLANLQYDCANCLEVIRHEQATWHCLSCFRVFHLQCIKRWACVEESGEGRSFRCPHCQAPQKPVTRYRCFCLKQQDPKLDAMLPCPHTCGATCGRRRGEGCPHPCPNQCHPGPCPECPVMVPAKRCPCGRTAYTHRCGKPDPRTTCESVCGKKLSCGNHTCPLTCHHGPCPPCDKAQETPCVCGKEVRALACGASAFRCDQPCDKLQRCGKHKCDVVCHSGSCPPCNRDPSLVVTCPCGKVLLQEGARDTCEAPIPTCGATCGRVLACGRHNCELPCHDSDCPPCDNKSQMHCPCRSTMAKVYCRDADNFKCQKKCKTKLQCGKHECERICCPARNDLNNAAHACTKPCGKKLLCGHVCRERCHRGPCPACPDIIVAPLYCRCGVEVLMPPLPCSTPPPSCRLRCNLERPCGHPSDDHLCHHGPCPPCSKPVSRTCAGGHKVLTNVLCSAEYACCLEQCEQALPCGHVCNRQCHGGPCVSAERPCTQQCGAVLPCGHGCTQRCHPNTPTCGKCATVVEMACDCGAQQLKMPCSTYLKRLEEHRKRSDASKPFVVECNDDCLYEQRLNLLKARSRKQFPSCSGKVVYSPKLWALADKAPDLISSVEQRLCEFLKSREQTMMLPPMSVDKRAVVHELSFYFHIQSESHDKEPNRTICLTKNIRSAVPNPLLSQSVKESANDPNAYVTSVMQRPDEAMKRIIVFEGERISMVDASRCLSSFAGDFVLVDPHQDQRQLLDDGSQAFEGRHGDAGPQTIYAVFLPHRVKAAYEALRQRGCTMLFRLIGAAYPPKQFAWEPSRPVSAAPKVNAVQRSGATMPTGATVFADPCEQAPPAVAAPSSARSWSSLVVHRTNAKARKQQESSGIDVANPFAALRGKH